MSGIVSTYLLTPHIHEAVRRGNAVRCPECFKQYQYRQWLVAACGQAAGAINWLARLQGRIVRWRQWPEQPWDFGIVTDWEWPNCCLEIEEVAWAGEEWQQRSKCYRFGWCGILDPQSEIHIVQAERW